MICELTKKMNKPIITKTDMTTTKSILFCRVSSKEQADEGYSLDAQEKLLTEYAVKHNFQIAKVYKIAETASKDQVRKLFNEVFEYTTKNRIPIIISEKIDRLTRSTKSAAIVDDWVREGSDREVHFVKESFVLNKNTKAHENLVWDMKVAIARFYTNNLSEEVRKGQTEKLSQGWLPYRSPLGYKTIGDKGHKTHIIDPQTAPYVKEIYSAYCTGLYSLHKLADHMYEQGLRTNTGRKMNANGVHIVLKNPFYYGAIAWNDKVYPGKQDQLISKDLFDMAQRVMKNGRPDKYKKHNPLFKGLVTCGACNHKVSWYEKKGNWYGRCAHFRNCPQGRLPIREDRLVEQIFPYLSELCLHDEDIQTIKTDLQSDHGLEIQSRQAKEADLSRSLSRNATKLDVAYNDRLEGRITPEQYDAAKTKVEADTQALLKAQERLQKDTVDYFDLGIHLMELANKAKDLFPFATKEEQQEIFTLCFEEMNVTDKSLAIAFTPWFAKLHFHLPQLKQICELQKTEQIYTGKEKTPTNNVDAFSWLGRLDSNQRPAD